MFGFLDADSSDDSPSPVSLYRDAVERLNAGCKAVETDFQSFYQAEIEEKKAEGMSTAEAEDENATPSPEEAEEDAKKWSDMLKGSLKSMVMDMFNKKDKENGYKALSKEEKEEEEDENDSGSSSTSVGNKKGCKKDTTKEEPEE